MTDKLKVQGPQPPLNDDKVQEKMANQIKKHLLFMR